MSTLAKIENANGSITWLEVANRKVRITNGGSIHHVTRAAAEKQIRHLEAKTNLRPSSIETLTFMKKVREYASANGL